MPSDILPSAELIDRTLKIENSYTISRMQVLESLPGNPVGIAFRPHRWHCRRDDGETLSQSELQQDRRAWAGAGGRNRSSLSPGAATTA